MVAVVGVEGLHVVIVVGVVLGVAVGFYLAVVVF